MLEERHVVFSGAWLEIPANHPLVGVLMEGQRSVCCGCAIRGACPGAGGEERLLTAEPPLSVTFGLEGVERVVPQQVGADVGRLVSAARELADVPKPSVCALAGHCASLSSCDPRAIQEYNRVHLCLVLTRATVPDMRSSQRVS